MHDRNVRCQLILSRVLIYFKFLEISNTEGIVTEARICHPKFGNCTLMLENMQLFTCHVLRQTITAQNYTILHSTCCLSGKALAKVSFRSSLSKSIIYKNLKIM